MKNKVFISYRRDDTKHIVGRIYDHLSDEFGDSNIFKDVDSIDPGENFLKKIEVSIKKCNVMLVIIGNNWATLNGENKINQDDDFVRYEISTALREGKEILPILVSEAPMPEKSDLPANIRELLDKNSLIIRSDPDFKPDLDKLIKYLDSRISNTFSLKRVITILLVASISLGSWIYYQETITLKENRVTEIVAEQQRVAEEVAEKQRVTEEEVEKQQVAEAEARKQRVVEEEARKQRVAEEEARKQRVAEEETRKQRVAEEKARKQRVAEEEAEKQRAAEENARKKMNKISRTTKAVVFEPPSNIRTDPNGKILCTVKTIKNIKVNINSNTAPWIKTTECGKTGYIHESQVKLNTSRNQQISNTELDEFLRDIENSKKVLKYKGTWNSENVTVFVKWQNYSSTGGKVSGFVKRKNGSLVEVFTGQNYERRKLIITINNGDKVYLTASNRGRVKTWVTNRRNVTFHRTYK